MPGPAARLGDSTAHGGVVAAGFPTVLIGGKPAARVSDLHVCPMVTPGVPPIPHVGMPIVSPGAPTVFIGGMPAATVGSIAPCVGPPDSVIMGCITVILGTGGGGAAGGGGGGGGGGAAANASAATAVFDNNESTTREKHWIEFKFVDKAGLPVSGTPYKLTDPDGKNSEGVLRLDGTIRRDALANEGQGKVRLTKVFSAEWSVSEADVGDSVKMSAKAQGFDDGTQAIFQVFRRDVFGPDVVVSQIETSVQAEKVEATWVFTVEDVCPDDETGDRGNSPRPYTRPVFLFRVILPGGTSRSGLLRLKDWIEIVLTDDKGKGISGEEYVVYFSNGEVRRGTLDGSGKAREEKIPPGTHEVKFPGVASVTEEDD